MKLKQQYARGLQLAWTFTLGLSLLLLFTALTMLMQDALLTNVLAAFGLAAALLTASIFAIAQLRKHGEREARASAMLALPIGIAYFFALAYIGEQDDAPGMILLALIPLALAGLGAAYLWRARPRAKLR